MIKIKKEKFSLLLFAVPSLVGVFLFYIAPFVLSSYYAVTDHARDFVGLDNFIDTAQNPMFLRGIENQLTFIGIAIPLTMCIALALAFFIRKTGKFKNLFMLVIFIPFLIPSGTCVWFWKCIFDVNGIFNKTMHLLGFEIANLYNTEFTMIIAVLIFLWKNVGITAILLYVGLNMIPKEYYELADTEGTTRFQKFHKITLVYLFPTLFIGVALLIINSFKIFKEVYLLFGNYPDESIYLLGHYMNNQFMSMNLQKLTSASFLMFFVIAPLIYFMFRKQNRYSGLYSSANFNIDSTLKQNSKTKYVILGFGAIIGFIFLIPTIFTVSNSFMSSFEIVNRYTTDVTAHNIADLSYNTMHFMRIGIIPDDFTLSGYFSFFADTDYMRMYLNSIIIVVPILIGQLIISPMTAYAFEQSKAKYKEVLFFIYVLIMLMPMQVLLVPNYLALDTLGLLDSYMAIILPAIFNPIGVFVVRIGLKGFPKECIEAAQNCGASHFKIFKSIVLPNIKAPILVMVLLLFSEYWNVIDQAIIFNQRPLSEPLSLYLSQIATENLGLFFSASCLYIIPILLMFIFPWKKAVGHTL